MPATSSPSGPDPAKAKAPARRPLDGSYRALLRIPTLPRILLAMQLARIAQSMVGVAIVLFTLQEYRSPQLAGVVTFAAVFPGLVVSPIAGALLDRHGRTRLILLDYALQLVALSLIGGLALAHALPATVLVLIAVSTSFTAILSHTGLRSLFPILVPKHLWERVNAVDSNGYVVATIVGPPLAAGLVAVLGGAAALIAIAAAFGLAAMAMIGVPDPESETVSTGSLLLDSWHGVVYWWRNRTLRALAFSITVLNVAYGIMTIALPLIVLDVLHGGELAVGLVFGLSGVSGMVSALAFGRLDSRDREWRMLVLPMFAMAPAYLLMLPVAAGATGPMIGFVLLCASWLVLGFLNGPMDIAMFTVRQRRTDPAWMGRAFAVSMGANFMGFPFGAAIGGTLAAVSLPGSVLVGFGLLLVGAVLATTMVPRTDPGPTPTPTSDRARKKSTG
jgi:MFS family permease